MVDKMHTQNYGYNDFYAKPVVRGGRVSAGSALTPQDGFIVKHYAGPVPYVRPSIDAVCFVYTCRRLIDLDWCCLLCICMPAIDRSLSALYIHAGD